MDFDYKVIAYCEYGVADPSKPSNISECQEPAPYYIWWGEFTNGLRVCQEHFDLIKNAEEKQDEG